MALTVRTATINATGGWYNFLNPNSIHWLCRRVYAAQVSNAAAA
jgi:hypothetical protein